MSDASTSIPAPPPPPAPRERTGHPSGPPVFLLALLIGAGLHLGVLMLFHFTILSPTMNPAPPAGPSIHFHADSPALRTQLAEAQFSPEQTYLSTEKNFSTQALPHATAPSQPVFSSFPVQPAPSEVDFHQPVATTPLATDPGDALKPNQWTLLSYLGQLPTTGSKLAVRGAIVRITRLDAQGPSAGSAIVLKWPPSMAPPAGNASWQPVSFILQFNAAGLASEPVLDPGFDALVQGNTPNDPDVNNFLREKLRGWFTQHPPLPPGQYEAVVGP